jgi:hypothetical protein
MLVRIIFILMLSLVWSVSVAQSSKKKKKAKVDTEQEPSSLDPYYPKENIAPKKNKSSSSAKITYDNAEEEFYDRMMALEKTKRKNERLMEKPQYSEPSYFGHKRPPKRHKPGKMKFCKVCGIRH